MLGLGTLFLISMGYLAECHVRNTANCSNHTNDCSNHTDDCSSHTDDCSNHTDISRSFTELPKKLLREKLNQNDVQVLIAFGNNLEAKKSLIQSSKLNSDGLIALCINPKPMDLSSDYVQDLFTEAFQRTKLTAEQEVHIAEIGQPTYTKALLQSTNLTAEGLVAICENSGYSVLSDDYVQGWFKNAFERTKLTAEQEVHIAEIGHIAYTKMLLQSTNLTAEGLVAACENSGYSALSDDYVQNLFAEAFQRTKLTAEQEVHIAEIGRFAYTRALLQSTNLTAEGLVAICENSECLALRDHIVQGWFKNAFERTELTAEQKVLIAKSRPDDFGLYLLEIL